ncbi:MAG: aminoacyl-tRNA hydrolase, partial [Desulfobacca sp.]|uniref:aminoacyl-tRNA hydrolase n=1 Tax=Desulfobacca sp. TaxID=2067990 RepID=UPI004049718B
PGLKYKKSRHNIGFQVIDVLASRWGIRLDQQSCSAHWGQGRFAGQAVVLAQPDTFMNLSGRAVFRLMAYFAASSADLLIIHDDLDLPLGRLKFVARGGAGGHRGIASIIQTLHTTEFVRLKIGIGRPQLGETVEQFVLSPFYPGEEGLVQTMVARAASAAEALLLAGLSRAMSLYHGPAAWPEEQRAS